MLRPRLSVQPPETAPGSAPARLPSSPPTEPDAPFVPGSRPVIEAMTAMSTPSIAPRLTPVASVKPSSWSAISDFTESMSWRSSTRYRFDCTIAVVSMSLRPSA